MPASVRCQIDHHDTRLVVRIVGELDLSTAARIRTTLLKCLAEQPDLLAIDLSGMTVTGGAPLAVFTAVARQAAMWPGTPLLLCAPSPATAALLRHGHAGSLPVFPTVAAARASTDGRVRMPTVSDELLPVGGAARRARDLSTEACGRWDLPDLVGPASIVVSELVSNVVAHAHTMMTLHLSLRRRYLHIAVRDGSTAEPVLCHASPLDPAGGRGLALVDAVSRRWGSLPTDGGKVVWAVLDA